MKQSFTLKALALGLAAVATFGASAARPQVQLGKIAPAQGKIELKSERVNTAQRIVKSGLVESYSLTAAHKITNASQKAEPVQQQPVSRAINPYGPWEDAGTLTYTFNNMFEGNGPTKTYNYQKRVNTRNENNFQIKVADWGALTSEENAGQGALPGCELVLTVTPGVIDVEGNTVFGVTTTNAETNASEGIALGWQAQGPDGMLDMYYYDHFTWANEMFKAGKMTSDDAQSWSGSSTYDPSTGKFSIMPIYGGTGDNLALRFDYGELNSAGTGYAKYWYDEIQLSGKFYNYDFDIDTDASYFYRNAGETAGHYKGRYYLNDNVVGVVKILKGKNLTNLQAEFDAMVSAMNAPTPDMAVFEGEDGWFDLAVNPYEDGDYTLVYGVGKEVDANGNTNIVGCYIEISLDGAEYVLDGFAKYNDVAMPAIFAAIGTTAGNLGLPSVYTTTCQVEKSEKVSGDYRLRAPYAQYPYKGKMDYIQEMDYLYYNVADPNKTYVEPSLTGLGIIDGENSLFFGFGSTHMLFKGETGIQDIFGTYANNKLTMPATSYEKDFTFNMNDGSTKVETKTMTGLVGFIMLANGGISNFSSPQNTADFLIETGVVDAIENVEASTDVNAPVEYFNLQGQKVLNPAAGQLVIKKQGGKVTKMIAR